LEGGRVVITRSRGTVSYPARFTLVAATNPCPCGWLGDDRRACRCPPGAVDRYQRSLSGPLLDRLDLRVAVSRPPLEALSTGSGAESSAAVRARVMTARHRQLHRQECLNAHLKPAGLRRHAPLGAGRRLLERWAEERGLTARGFHRAWRVARTAADLDAGGVTVAVLGTGVDVGYPAENAGLAAEIVGRGGALVSEFADGTPPRRGHFPKRNWTMAAISELVVVVEAAEGSGALITAEAA